MGFRVKIAETAEELDALFRCRHRVYVHQDGWAPRSDGRIVDACDAWPAPDCVNLVALVGDEVVAGMRLLTWKEGRPSSSDQMFDFEPHFRPGTVRASASMLCVDVRAKAQVARLTNALMSVAYHHCLHAGVEEFYGCIRASLWPVSERIGGRALAPVQTTGTLSWVPFLFDMERILDRDPWGRFIRDHGVREFLGIWSRRFVDAGTTVYARGEPAEEAFVVVVGEVELADADGRAVVLERPWMFGEDEMLDGRRRAHDAVARTACDLIVVDRDAFFRHVALQPMGAVRFAHALLQPDVAPRRPRDLADSLDFPDTPTDAANRPPGRSRPQPAQHRVGDEGA